MRRAGRTLAVALAVLAAGGCGAPGPREDDAVTAALAFETALGSSRYAQACSLLAPRTRRDVAAAEDCGRALAKENLPVATGRASSAVAEVYGRQAKVRLTGDTLFLSQFDRGWKVIAAGCTPRPEQPYDCRVKGG
ncbi:hypothetical protein AB0469_33345 [Streptomyces sp. NPDC093801]|uniref:hypothetical protein n=1 Tax=Streptomyces sp. NPDC093801 TaxID=3155203 RepID=UPI00344D1B05